MALPDRRCPLAAGQLVLLVSLSSLFLSTPESSRPRWQLVWHDEFDNPGLDAGKWVRETGGGGWGNGELEFYTDRVEIFFFSSRRRHTRLQGDWSSDVCSSDLYFDARLRLGVFQAIRQRGCQP